MSSAGGIIALIILVVCGLVFIGIMWYWWVFWQEERRTERREKEAELRREREREAAKTAAKDIRPAKARRTGLDPPAGVVAQPGPGVPAPAGDHQPPPRPGYHDSPAGVVTQPGPAVPPAAVRTMIPTGPPAAVVTQPGPAVPPAAVRTMLPTDLPAAVVTQPGPGAPAPPGGDPIVIRPGPSGAASAGPGSTGSAPPAAAVAQPGLRKLGAPTVLGGDATAKAKAAPKGPPGSSAAPGADAPAGDDSGSDDGATGSRTAKHSIRPERTPGLVVPDEEFRPPSYWKNRDVTAGFQELVPASPTEESAIMSLLASTFKAVKTRDRKDAKLPKRLRMVSVRRIENSALWENYIQGRFFLKQKRDHKCTPIRGGTYGGEILTERGMPPDRSSLLKRVNETLFWHGTSPHGARSISATGFRLDYSGSHVGTMYGRGVYFAECASKSDEYAAEEIDASGRSTSCLLLCRVALGELLHMTAGGVSTYSLIKAAIEDGAYDSVLGDREASVGTYREFVVYANDQVYPEYLVTYEREYA